MMEGVATNSPASGPPSSPLPLRSASSSTRASASEPSPMPRPIRGEAARNCAAVSSWWADQRPGGSRGPERPPSSAFSRGTPSASLLSSPGPAHLLSPGADHLLSPGAHHNLSSPVPWTPARPDVGSSTPCSTALASALLASSPSDALRAPSLSFGTEGGSDDGGGGRRGPRLQRREPPRSARKRRPSGGYRGSPSFAVSRAPPAFALEFPRGPAEAAVPSRKAGGRTGGKKEHEDESDTDVGSCDSGGRNVGDESAAMSDDDGTGAEPFFPGSSSRHASKGRHDAKTPPRRGGKDGPSPYRSPEAGTANTAGTPAVSNSTQSSVARVGAKVRRLNLDGDKESGGGFPGGTGIIDESLHPSLFWHKPRGAGNVLAAADPASGRPPQVYPPPPPPSAVKRADNIGRGGWLPQPRREDEAGGIGGTLFGGEDAPSPTCPGTTRKKKKRAIRPRSRSRGCEGDDDGRGGDEISPRDAACFPLSFGDGGGADGGRDCGEAWDSPRKERRSPPPASWKENRDDRQDGGGGPSFYRSFFQEEKDRLPSFPTQELRADPGPNDFSPVSSPMRRPETPRKKQPPTPSFASSPPPSSRRGSADHTPMSISASARKTKLTPRMRLNEPPRLFGDRDDRGLLNRPERDGRPPRQTSPPGGLRTFGRANSFMQMFTRESSSSKINEGYKEGGGGIFGGGPNSANFFDEEEDDDDVGGFLHRAKDPNEPMSDAPGAAAARQFLPPPRREDNGGGRRAGGDDNFDLCSPAPPASCNSFSRFAADFEVISALGNGSFGSVYRVRNRTDQRMYAIKAARREARGRADRERMLREVYALADLGDHTECRGGVHVVRYHQAWMEGNRLYIQTELCQGTLKAEMETARRSQAMSLSGSAPITPGGGCGLNDEKRRYKLLREMLLALELVHKSGMIHLDIKPENIFIKNDQYKIGDFGLVSKLEDHDDVEEGDSRYMSMEMLSGDLDDLTKSDIFSLGATMYEVCLGQNLPANGQEWQDIRAGNLQTMPNTAFDLRMIVREMMAPDRNNRPSAAKLLTKRQLLSEEQRQLLVERNRVAAANMALDAQMERFRALTPHKQPKFARSNTIS